MSKQWLEKEMNWEIKARLIQKGSDTPLTGTAYKVRLFDREFLEDEYLGECTPGEDGVVTFSFPASAVKGVLDDPMPDFFFVLYKNDTVVFRSTVMENMNTEAIEQYKHGVGEVIDLGTFLVEG